MAPLSIHFQLRVIRSYKVQSREGYRYESAVTSLLAPLVTCQLDVPVQSSFDSRWRSQRIEGGGVVRSARRSGSIIHDLPRRSLRLMILEGALSSPETANDAASATPSAKSTAKPAKRVSYHESVEEHQRRIEASRSSDDDNEREGISREPSIGRERPPPPNSFLQRRRSQQMLERGVYHSERVIGSPSVCDSMKSNTENELPSRRRTIVQEVDYSFTLSVRKLANTLLRGEQDELQTRQSEEHFVTAVLRSDPLAPAVELSYPFSYPVAKLPVTRTALGTLNMDAFDDLTQIASGSNADIFRARLAGGAVCIKALKQTHVGSEVARLEFESECGILSRMNHPNIVSLYGHGHLPRRFLVMELLTGGTLKDKLMERRPFSVTNLFFQKPRFDLTEVYRIFLQLCDAVDYLHHRLHSDACIIHRDLKPDNIGFSSDGHIVLFDFGLSICVRKFVNECSTYAMSGGTGSLRYMAPEVSLDQPYNEKVDVYSCGILMWQVATNEVPFNGAKKKDFIKFVAGQGYRPKLRAFWPASFKDLLRSMWDSDSLRRPSMESVLCTLRTLSAESALL